VAKTTVYPYTNQTGRYVNISGNHNKWWEFEYDPNSGHLITRWGKIGHSGQSNVKTGVTGPQVATLINSKLSKGYMLAVGNGSSVNPVTKTATGKGGRWKPGQAPIDRRQLRRVDANGYQPLLLLSDFDQYIEYEYDDGDEVAWKFPNGRGVYTGRRDQIDSGNTAYFDAVYWLRWNEEDSSVTELTGDNFDFDPTGKWLKNNHPVKTEADAVKALIKVRDASTPTKKELWS
jgi:predicted DNA-binding WGR domain protein